MMKIINKKIKQILSVYIPRALQLDNLVYRVSKFILCVSILWIIILVILTQNMVHTKHKTNSNKVINNNVLPLLTTSSTNNDKHQSREQQRIESVVREMEGKPVNILSILSGQSIVVKYEDYTLQVSLLGTNAPDINQIPFSFESRNTLSQLLKSPTGYSQIILEYDSHINPMGSQSVIAYVFLYSHDTSIISDDNLNDTRLLLNNLMIRSGNSIAYKLNKKYKYFNLLNDSSKYAKNNHQGLFYRNEGDVLKEMPHDYRKRIESEKEIEDNLNETQNLLG